MAAGAAGQLDIAPARGDVEQVTERVDGRKLGHFEQIENMAGERKRFGKARIRPFSPARRPPLRESHTGIAKNPAARNGHATAGT